MINGGGIINVAAEIRAVQAGEAYHPAWVDTKVDRLMRTLEEVLDRAEREGRPTQEVAVDLEGADWGQKARVGRVPGR